MAGVMTMQGRRILVVEENYVIAEELSDAGADVLGPVLSVGDALRLIAAKSRIDGVLPDVNVRQEAIWSVVDVLLACGIPLVLAVGYVTSTIPHVYAYLSRCEKPASGRVLTRAFAPQIPDLG